MPKYFIFSTKNFSNFSGVSSAFEAYNDATVFQLDTAAKKEKAGVPMLYVSMSSPCNFKKDTVLKNDPSAYVLFTPPVRKASLFSAKPGPDVVVTAKSPAKAAPIAEQTPAISSSIWQAFTPRSLRFASS